MNTHELDNIDDNARKAPSLDAIEQLISMVGDPELKSSAQAICEATGADLGCVFATLIRERCRQQGGLIPPR